MKVKALDEFDEFESESISNSSEDLRFTGNWFIDAGILGFVNLMEEVYGWDLDKLQIQIKERIKLVYYWYFPIAFVYYNNKLRGKTVGPIPNPPRYLENEIGIFDASWEWICSKKEFESTTPRGKKKRIDLSFKKPFNYFTNFLFFQPEWDINKQKDAFMEILGLKDIESDVLKNIDKTINKFLPSTDEFSNVPYSKSLITLENLLNFHPRSLIFALTFPLAFLPSTLSLESLGRIQKILRENIIFYSPNLKFTYHVNKRLRELLERWVKEKENRLSIFQITWRAIIDSIMETQSIWTLENMYLIKYRLGGRQDILSAEFIGIPKLQASIVVDDVIRDTLNRNIPTPKKERGRRIWIWILEEFINCNPLLPHLINYIHEDLNKRLNKNEKSVGKNTLVYTNCVDAQLREFESKRVKDGWFSTKLFGDEFFIGYREILFKLKETAREMFSIARAVYNVYNNNEERERTASRLLSTIRKRDKYAFTNALLKSFIGKTEKQKEIRNLNRYLFEKIVSNDANWENYALTIVIGLIYGGVESGESEETEE